MFAIGVILVIVGVGGGALLASLLAPSTQTVQVSALGVSVGFAPVTLLAAGAVAVLLLWLGVRLAGAAFRHRRAQRKELRRHREEVQRLRAHQTTTTATTATTGAPTTQDARTTTVPPDATGPAEGTVRR